MSKSESLFPVDENYTAFLRSLKDRIRQAQIKAALAVNNELILLYWQIGREILHRQQQQGWGAKVIDRLAQDLKREFPDTSGFSSRNLKYMRTLAESYPDEQIVLRLIAQIPWGHNQTLLNKLNSYEQRIWYVQKTLENGWSRDILTLQIETNLFSRQGVALTNFERTLPNLDSDLAQQLVKDPYNFNFLTLSESVKERDLEKALVERIRDFLLELGLGFAFVGSQYRLEVEGDEYFLDLLFYHLKLHCYIVIDLKVTEFKPEYSGKMNFYISAVNSLMRTEVENPTIGIILCRSKKKTTVEFALDAVQNPIGVSTYKLRDDLPATLQDCLPTVEQLEMELEAVVSELEEEQD
ncbi:MAG: PDDEXK nuclease domain-containing protein [Cyanobacteria bacterium CAN_BIN43]|nr:PDDEXK nuclease domain-containing protein [Cyanobacteria bacterium CAN_BIN43]